MRNDDSSKNAKERKGKERKRGGARKERNERKHKGERGGRVVSDTDQIDRRNVKVHYNKKTVIQREGERLAETFNGADGV